MPLSVLSPTKFSSLLVRFLQLALVLGLSLTTASGQAQTPNAPQAPILRLRIVGGLAGHTLGLHLVTSHIHSLPITWGLAVFGANKNAWDALPPGLKALLSRELPRLEAAIWMESERESTEGMACNTGRPQCKTATEGAIDQVLTESLVLDNIDDTIAKMTALKALGVRFSMDDFGTGQSSLSYLTRLPLDQLKIDQSFVRNIGIKSSDGVIVQTIIGMASNLGLEVIAEGVETVEQKAFLAAHGCSLYQGYLCGRPTPVADFETLLKIVFPHA